MSEKSHQLLEATFRSIKDALLVVRHPERVIEACNPAAEEMFGWEEVELRNASTRRLHVDDEHYRRFGRESQQALSEKGEYRSRFKMKRADGSIFYTEHVVSFVGDSEEPDRAVSVVRDITERVEREQQLEMKSRAIDDSPIGITITDATKADNPICFVNEGFTRLTGYHPENILGRNCRFLQGEATDRDTVQRIREAIDAEEPVEVDIRNYRASGEMFWNHLRITPVRNQNGNVTHFIGYQQDITERKQMETSLRASEQRYRTLFEEVNESFLLVGINDEILEVNKNACELLGYEREELVGRSLQEVLPSEVVEGTEKGNIVRSRMENHGRSMIYTYVLHRDSTRIPVESSRARIHVGDQEAVILSIRNRSELERIRQKNERKSTFVSQVTHDLRTPLNSITGMARLLMDTDLSGEQQGYLQTIINASRTMERLTSDILDLNRIERGEIILDEEPFEIQQLLGEVISLYSQELKTRNLTMSTQVAEEVPDRLIGDPARLKQVLHNLVDNAIKHTREGTIKISVDMNEQQTSSVRLAFMVSDTGNGIPESELDHIFEEHNQLNSFTTGSGQGLGIGLTICRNLLELMNGDIEVESEVGEGTTFTFTVELEEAGSQKVGGSVALDDVHVLLVEDNALVRNVFRTYLEAHEINVVEVESGQAAFEELTKTDGTNYDVVFLDRRLGDMSGDELLRQLAEEEEETIDPERIYIISGDPAEQIQKLIDPLTCAGFMEKPVQESELIDAVSSVVRTPDKQMDDKDLATLKEDIRNSAPDPLHVLGVDDDQNTRILLEKLLDPIVDELTLVTNGKEAVDKRFEEEPSLILMDLEMPEMDGLEAIEEIRTKENEQNRPRVPMIIQTAKAMKHVEEDCLKAGADTFLRKPMKRPRLYRAILDNLT